MNSAHHRHPNAASALERDMPTGSVWPLLPFATVHG